MIRALMMMTLLAGALAQRPAAAAETDAPPYEVREGRVFIAGWDDAVETTDAEILRLQPEQFADAGIYRKRLIVSNRDAWSSAILVAPNATDIIVVARSEAVENQFPRLRVTLTPEDDPATTQPVVLSEFYVATLTLQEFRCPVPDSVKGKRMRVRLEPRNWTDAFEGRLARVAYVSLVERRESPRAGD